MNSFICMLCGLSLVITWLLYKPALHFAQKHLLLDNPEARKLQKTPVPVFGGVAVAIGIFVPMTIAAFTYQSVLLNTEMIVMAGLVCIGVYDDVKNVSAWKRFLLELLLVWWLVWYNSMTIDDLHGLWGRQFVMSNFTGVPLTLVAGVGIINAINMIDGVDGYSSGYGIMSNVAFALIFFMLGETIPCVLSSIAASALFPFYMHNVFGDKSKMFIGDGGSLLIGMIMVCDVLALFHPVSSEHRMQGMNISVVALALSILAIPVFDTLRVMFARIMVEKSPFSPDMTHLHHTFIRMGFSHVGTSTTIILMEALIIGIWALAWKLGLGIDGQFYLVVVLGLLATCGIYYYSEYSIKTKNGYYRLMHRLGEWTHFEKSKAWRALQRIVDKF